MQRYLFIVLIVIYNITDDNISNIEWDEEGSYSIQFLNI